MSDEHRMEREKNPLTDTSTKDITMFQQIILIGNLGRDPEMRYTPSGVPVTDFSVGSQ